MAEIESAIADLYRSVVTTSTNQYVLSMWSLKDDEYQTSYNDEPLDEHGVQQEEAPEEEEVGGEEQQEEEEEDTAEGSQVFDTEEVCWDPPYTPSMLHLDLALDWLNLFSESAVETQH